MGGWWVDKGCAGCAMSLQRCGFVETGVYIQDFGTWDRDALLCLGIAFFFILRKGSTFNVLPGVAKSFLFFDIM